MSTTEKFRQWAKRNNVTGERYGRLMARLVKSPKNRREWAGR